LNFHSSAIGTDMVSVLMAVWFGLPRNMGQSAARAEGATTVDKATTSVDSTLVFGNRAICCGMESSWNGGG
jgi:hypothetical protein